MDIVIIGSGNVATVLGRKFKAAGHAILQVYSRNTSAASKLAYEWDTESTNYISLLNPHAQVYIFAVPDDSIDELAGKIKLAHAVVAHTAASVPGDILKDVSDHYGVFYPLQTLRKEVSGSLEIPIYYDGNDEQAKSTLGSLARSIAGDKVTRAGDDERLKLHVAAVIAGNFTNHMYALAEWYCKKEGLDFQQLLPLIMETASRVRDISPTKSQTGPAIRHDAETIHKHLELLKEHPPLKNIYLLLTESIQQFH